LDFAELLPMTQLALEFERAAGAGPEVHRWHVEKMIEMLRARDWQTAKQLGAMNERDQRVLRAIANASEGQIISGQKGYKLTIEATLPEIDRAYAWLRHQGREMIRRALEIQRVRHRHFAAAHLSGSES
jgi:hypothetical protein